VSRKVLAQNKGEKEWVEYFRSLISTSPLHTLQPASLIQVVLHYAARHKFVRVRRA